MDAASFSTGQGCPVEKPRNPPAHLEGQRPGRRVIRGALLFGYFLLGKQEKVTRPPAGGRKPAAGEPGRDTATTKHRRSESVLHRKVEVETFPRAPAPHPNPL